VAVRAIKLLKRYVHFHSIKAHSLRSKTSNGMYRVLSRFLKPDT